MGRAGAKGDRGDTGVEGMKGNRVSSREFLPISRGRISASFPIENSHLFSQYQVCFYQIKKSVFFLFFFFFFCFFLEIATTYEKQ